MQPTGVTDASHLPHTKMMWEAVTSFGLCRHTRVDGLCCNALLIHNRFHPKLARSAHVHSSAVHCVYSHATTNVPRYHRKLTAHQSGVHRHGPRKELHIEHGFPMSHHETDTAQSCRHQCLKTGSVYRLPTTSQSEYGGLVDIISLPIYPRTSSSLIDEFGVSQEERVRTICLSSPYHCSRYRRSARAQDEYLILAYTSSRVGL